MEDTYIWVKWVNQSERGYEYRYKLETFYSSLLMNEDGSENCMFALYKYWKDNNGEWLPCKTNAKVYVTIETLLSSFVVVDGELDNALTECRESRRSACLKKLEDQIAPFIFNDTEECGGKANPEGVSDLNPVGKILK